MKKTNKKLSLARSTVRVLAITELDAAQGGAITTTGTITTSTIITSIRCYTDLCTIKTY